MQHAATSKLLKCGEHGVRYRANHRDAYIFPRGFVKGQLVFGQWVGKPGSGTILEGSENLKVRGERLVCEHYHTVRLSRLQIGHIARCNADL